MTKADEFQWVAQGATASLATWHAYDPTVRVDLSCSAVRAGKELLFIDPIPLADEALEELTAAGSPNGVIVSSANHERAAGWYAKRFGIPVFAPAETRPEFEAHLPTMQPFVDGDLLLGTLKVISLPGGAIGESAFYWPELGGVLIVGDALIHLDATGFDFLPDKYCSDAALLRKAARERLRFPNGLRIIAFAHGNPIVNSTHERLEALVQATE